MIRATVAQPSTYTPPTAGALPTREYPSNPTPTTQTATAKVDTPAPPPGGAPQLSDYEQQRKRLEPRVWSGKASEEEIMLLKAMCSHMGDHVCRDRANAMLKKKREQTAGN